MQAHRNRILPHQRRHAQDMVEMSVGQPDFFQANVVLFQESTESRKLGVAVKARIDDHPLPGVVPQQVRILLQRIAMEYLDVEHKRIKQELQLETGMGGVCFLKALNNVFR